MMHERIIAAIKNIELEHKCAVLFACESGSRAWGFASPDSDYDIRFIYTNSLEWYLKVEDKPDIINKMLPEELDICGWDLQKTLRLFAKCNLCLNEWLNSPCIYYKNENFHNKLKMLIPEYFNSKKAMHHYLSTANKMVENHLQTNSVNIKKLFYVLRPLLACIWIMNKQTMPPTAFKELFAQHELSHGIMEFINLLLAEKSVSSEKHKIHLPKEISVWINEQILKLTMFANTITTTNVIKWEPLNAIMLEMNQQ